MGTTIQVPTLEGTRVDLRIPPGTQPNDIRTLYGRGIQKLSQPTGVKGNMNVIVKVLIPKAGDLTNEQHGLLERFKELNHKRTYSTNSESLGSKNDNADSKSEGFLKKTFDKLKDTLCDGSEDKKRENEK